MVKLPKNQPVADVENPAGQVGGVTLLHCQVGWHVRVELRGGTWKVFYILFYLYLPGFSIIFFCSLFRAKVTPKLGKSDDVPLQLPNVKFILWWTKKGELLGLEKDTFELSHLFLCILYIVYTRWLPSLRFMYILNFEVQSNSYLGICCYLLKGVINDFDEQLIRGWWKSDSKLHKISKCQNNRNGGSLRNQKSNQIRNVFNQILQRKHLKMSGMISLSNFNDLFTNELANWK